MRNQPSPPILADQQNFQDWKKGNHCMGSTAPKYEPEAPKVEDADISQFPLQASKYLSVYNFLWIKLTDCLMAFVHEYVESAASNQHFTYKDMFFDQVVRLEKNPEETNGWKKFKVTLSQTFRLHWLEDVVYSQEWRELLTDFDNKLLVD